MVPRQESIFAPPKIYDAVLGVKLPKMTKQEQLSEEARGSCLKRGMNSRVSSERKDYNTYACMNIIPHPSLD